LCDDRPTVSFVSSYFPAPFIKSKPAWQLLLGQAFWWVSLQFGN
jgi:hypothetical protein